MNSTFIKESFWLIKSRIQRSDTHKPGLIIQYYIDLNTCFGPRDIYGDAGFVGCRVSIVQISITPSKYKQIKTFWSIYELFANEHKIMRKWTWKARLVHAVSGSIGGSGVNNAWVCDYQWQIQKSVYQSCFRDSLYKSTIFPKALT